LWSHLNWKEKAWTSSSDKAARYSTWALDAPLHTLLTRGLECVLFFSWAGNEYIYSMEAAKGHLPLTSCLRGTQLLRELFNHPAIAPPAVKGADGKEATGGSGGGGAAGGKPDWLKF
jgi:hypothetical protein